MNNHTKARFKRQKVKGNAPSISEKKNIKMVITANGTRHLPLDDSRRQYKREFPNPNRT
jgi:hypothetical protein